jgi:glycosyltransferase involved in cell wall biosynthesis
MARNFLSHAPRVAGCLKNIAGSLEDAKAIFQNRFPAERSKDRLIILDDIFPSLLSAFRIAEYNVYLNTFDTAEVHSTGAAFPLAGEKRGFSAVLSDYEKLYPSLGKRVFKFNRRRNLQGKLMYTIFLNNAFSFIDTIKKYNVPFVFTLYPGGGFQLGIEESDSKLRKVCSLPSLKKIIVTQKVSQQYLLERKFCEPSKVEFIYGGVLPSERLAKTMVPKKYYRQEKGTFDICFVANKQTIKGIDKGYDVFVEVARLLCKMHQDIFFHVVGPFDGADICVDDIASRIKFYGFKYTDFFAEFYPHMDMILSPNAPFVISPGSFDGFPTGACVEAGLCGVAVFCTDVLGQNSTFKDGEEIVLISRDIQDICRVIDKYYQNIGGLYQLARKGQEAFREVFDIEAQMKPRLRILSEWMQ